MFSERKRGGGEQGVAFPSELIPISFCLFLCFAFFNLCAPASRTISNLRRAHIGVWMITGDKQETAINIGMSCNLVRDPAKLLKCNAHSFEEAKGAVERIEAEAKQRGIDLGDEVKEKGKNRADWRFFFGAR